MRKLVWTITYQIQADTHYDICILYIPNKQYWSDQLREGNTFNIILHIVSLSIFFIVLSLKAWDLQTCWWTCWICSATTSGKLWRTYVRYILEHWLYRFYCASKHTTTLDTWHLTNSSCGRHMKMMRCWLGEIDHSVFDASKCLCQTKICLCALCLIQTWTRQKLHVVTLHLTWRMWGTTFLYWDIWNLKHKTVVVMFLSRDYEVHYKRKLSL